MFKILKNMINLHSFYLLSTDLSSDEFEVQLKS